MVFSTDAHVLISRLPGSAPTVKVAPASAIVVRLPSAGPRGPSGLGVVLLDVGVPSPPPSTAVGTIIYRKL